MIALVSVPAFSQSKHYPLAVGVGVNFPDFRGARNSFGEYFTDAFWEHKGPPIKVTLGGNLIPSLNLELSGNYAKGDNIAINQPEGTEITFWDIDLNLQYRFANDYILKDKSWWDPYIFVGPQVSHFNDTTYFSIDGGLGMNFWIVKHVAVFAQAAYDVTIDGPGYYHFGFGVKYRFNPTPDRDKDGIADKKDKCPDVPGLAKFEGCPDSDGDGIPDMDDACPKDPGIAPFKGCPDTDGDGIPDKDDACPLVPGLKEFKGCADRDKDGIPDNEDKCADLPGVVALQGCPDADGDGITDADDKCPREKGPASNNGCPVAPPPPPPFTFPDLIIYYNTAKNDVPVADRTRLDEAAKLMKEHPEATFVVWGHTDNVGGDEFNLSLSDKRATAVYDYLIKQGVPAANIQVKGYGESAPAATNDTDEGKAKNRRVEVKKL